LFESVELDTQAPGQLPAGFAGSSSARPHRATWDAGQQAAVDAAFLGLEAAADSLRRDRMVPTVLGLIPTYAEPTIGADGPVGSVKRALAIVQACVWERRFPDAIESEELRQIGLIAAELDISSADLRAARLICGVIGFQHLELALGATAAGSSAVPELRSWFHSVLGVVGDLMDEGFDRPRLVGAVASTQPVPATTLRSEVAEWLKQHQANIAWRTTREVLASGIFADFQGNAAFPQETRRWLEASVCLFTLAFEQGRGPTNAEMAAVSAHASTGIHARIPVAVTQAGVSYAADQILKHVTNELLRDVPELPDNGLMGEIITRAIQFRDDLIGGVAESRERLRLCEGAWFDGLRMVTHVDGTHLRLRPLEGLALVALVTAGGRFVSTAALSHALSRNRGSMEPATIYVTMNRLRKSLAGLDLGGALVSERAHGYAWRPAT